MRISDWSSDVCSSDLRSQRIGVADDEVSHLRDRQRDKCEEDSSQLAAEYNETQYSAQRGPRGRAGQHAEPGAYTERQEIGRASCREECVSTCRSRWSPKH